MKQIVVAVSGYFDPPTPAHISYFKDARLLGDKLVVILNNDEQLLLKRAGTSLDRRIRYPLKNRIQILEAFKWVDEVFVSIDTDGTIAESLKIVKPNIFAKGGDRVINNLPQAELNACKDIGCEIVCGVGCDKTHSSSWYNWE